MLLKEKRYNQKLYLVEKIILSRRIKGYRNFQGIRKWRKKMKMKNEDFFYLAKIFQIIFFWNFIERRWFQIRIQIFHILLRSKVIAFQSRLKIGKNRQNRPTLQGYNFWRKQYMKNLNTYLKSAKFKVSKKYNWKYFGQVEKIFIFSSSFSKFLKNFYSL